MWEGKRVERKRSSKRGVRVRKELEGVNQEGVGDMDMGREKGWKELLSVEVSKEREGRLL